MNLYSSSEENSISVISGQKGLLSGTADDFTCLVLLLLSVCDLPLLLGDQACGNYGTI